MIEVVTMSSKGQVVVPKGMRRIMGLKQNDKFVLTNEKDAIIMKRVDEAELKSRMRALLVSLASDSKKAGITEKDIAKEVAASRKR